ncbi:SOS response-associated peptidase family protein [Pseudomonas sp. MS-1(2024)]|uniref:SOS response-associated peptidase family protein n=1 Tax=Pseudomonas sp. MS-1(2024) TaxID=3112251 RepID=UPI003FA37C48
MRDLERQYGITADDVAQAGCYSYDLAAWRLRGHIRNDSGDLTGSFGLIPGWSKDTKIARRCYNARSETAAVKPSFRNAWKYV